MSENEVSRQQQERQVRFSRAEHSRLKQVAFINEDHNKMSWKKKKLIYKGENVNATAEVSDIHKRRPQDN